MIVVAKRLSKIALDEPVAKDADLFGRSAFNRYYYASYLITRDMISQINSSWRKTHHKDIPGLLTNAIIKSITRELRKQEKSGLIRTGEAASLRSGARAAANSLASLLRDAYHVRCVADYEPEQLTLRNGDVIKLSNHTIGEADSWPRRAEMHAKGLIRVWQKLGRP